MPTYGYECRHCGHNFDAFQKINDSPLDKCPKCDLKVKRVIAGGAGIIFKGKGFYATDYRKKTAADTKKPDACPKMKDGCEGCKNRDE